MSHQVWQKLVESMPGQVHVVIKAKKGTWQTEYIQKFMYIFFQRFNFSLKMFNTASIL